MHQTFKNIENGDPEKNKNQIRDPTYQKGPGSLNRDPFNKSAFFWVPLFS